MIVDQKRIQVWWGILFSSIVLFLLFASLIFVPFRHTWQEPANAPGTLKSDRWSRDFWFTLTISLAIFVPITAAFMTSYPTADASRGLHVALCIIFFMYFVVIMIIWSVDYSNANMQTAANARNPFNDDRWCLVNNGITGADCVALYPINPPVVPPVTQPMLAPNGAMAFKFWMLVIYIVVLLVDILFTLIVFQPAVGDYIRSKLDQKQNRLTKNAEEGKGQPTDGAADEAGAEAAALVLGLGSQIQQPLLVPKNLVSRQMHKVGGGRK